MAESKELKLSKEAFDNAIQKLKEYKNTLISLRDSSVLDNDSMKKDWIGQGGTSFILGTNVVEEKFLEILNQLEEEINDLNTSSSTMFGLDYYLGQTIVAAIGVADEASSLVNSSSK